MQADLPPPAVVITREHVAEAVAEVEACLRDPSVRKRLAQTGVRLVDHLESGASRIESKVMKRPEINPIPKEST